MQVQLKWCAVIEFMTTENMPLINILQQIEVAYGDRCVDIGFTLSWATKALREKRVIALLYF
jgi:hypothetical protein